MNPEDLLQDLDTVCAEMEPDDQDWEAGALMLVEALTLPPELASDQQKDAA